MRVLVIDEELPFPLNTGKRLRTFNLLKHLAKKHQITFMCRRHEGAGNVDAVVFDDIGIKVVTIPHPIPKKSGFKFYLALFANLFSIHPYTVVSHYSNMMTNAISEELRKGNFDLIHCEWTPYAVNLQSAEHIPTVVNAHNVEAMIWKRNFEVTVNPAVKAFLWLQWKKMERFERRVFVRFNKIAAVSEPDKAMLSRWAPPHDITVVENGVDMEFFTSGNNRVRPCSLVFSGSLDWWPNVDAVMYFLDSVWPIVQKKTLEARFTIIGRNPMPALIARVAREGKAELTGTVEDVRPYISNAAVYVVPLRIGGGSRLKILEALSMKKAVVSTTIGCEGLSLVPERDLVVADNPEKFANHILDLFTDDEKRRQIAENGHQAVLKKYQWQFIAAKLDRLWEEAIG